MKNLKNALFIGLLLSQGNLFSCSSGLLAIRQLNMVVRSGQVLDLVQKKNKELTTLYNNLKHKDTCHQAKMVIHQKIALAEKEWTCVNKKLMKNP